MHIQSTISSSRERPFEGALKIAKKIGRHRGTLPSHPPLEPNRTRAASGVLERAGFSSEPARAHLLNIIEFLRTGHRTCLVKGASHV